MANQSAEKKKKNLLKPESLLESVRSRYFLFLVRLFNDYVQEKPDLPQTRESILEKMPYQGDAYKAQALSLLNNLFRFKDDPDLPPGTDLQGMKARIKPPYPELGTIPLQMTSIEERWLRTFLDAPEAGFLLPEDLRRMLSDRLKDVTPFDRSFWRRNQLAGDDLQDETNLSCLRLITSALREPQLLQLGGNGEGQTLLPVRLRYNMLTNRYSLVAQTETGDFTRRHLHELKGLQAGKPLTKKQWEAAQKAYGDYCQSHRAYFHLQLKDEKNARERCYASFAAFDKKSYREQDGSYRLIISFYTFDEADIVNRILALGSSVIVLPDQPEAGEKDIETFGCQQSTHLRQQVIKRLIDALPFYEDAAERREQETP
jgi:hypothetical protein